MKRFVPLHDRVLVKPMAQEQQKKLGLAVPKIQEEKPTSGIVVAVGMDADRTSIIDLNNKEVVREGNMKGVAVGEVVQWSKYSGREVIHNGEPHLLLRLEEVDGRLEDEP